MSRTTNLKVWAAVLLAALGVAMLVALGFTRPAQAINAGDLDVSFDHDGRVVFDVFGGVDDSARAVAIQPDGKIVLAGSWCGFGAQCSTGTFVLARFNPDGSLDTAFGNNGRTLVAFPNGRAEATGVAIHADGKIVAAGISYDRVPCGVFDACDRDIAVARYNPNGSLDPSFNGDGKAIMRLTGEEYVRAATIQSNGKVIVAGQTDGDFLLARYNTDGSEDSSFEGGAVGTDFGGSGDLANGVAIQADGRIVAAGETNVGGDRDFAISRYHAITDNTPPNTTITGGPSGPVNSTSVTFAFVSSEPGSKFQCSLDGALFSGCTSPKSYTKLEDGSHIFRVRAIDAAGNTDQSPAQRSFTVDTQTPRI